MMDRFDHLAPYHLEEDLVPEITLALHESIIELLLGTWKGRPDMCL